jgi:4'-phosphopantetheinyl transferase EntD
MAHEQNQTAMAASNAAQQEIRQHGIEIEQQAFQAQAQQVQQQIAAQQAQQQAEQQANIQAQQTGLEHQAAIEQAAQQQPVLAPQPTTPPTGAI